MALKLRQLPVLPLLNKVCKRNFSRVANRSKFRTRQRFLPVTCRSFLVVLKVKEEKTPPISIFISTSHFPHHFLKSFRHCSLSLTLGFLSQRNTAEALRFTSTYCCSIPSPTANIRYSRLLQFQTAFTFNTSLMIDLLPSFSLALSLSLSPSLALTCGTSSGLS